MQAEDSNKTTEHPGRKITLFLYKTRYFYKTKQLESTKATKIKMKKVPVNIMNKSIQCC
jgi:hypothetical protein